MNLSALEAHRDEVVRLAVANRVTRIRVFESYHKNPQPTDTYLLVDIQRGDHVSIVMHLTFRLKPILGCFVWVVSDQTVPKRHRARVLREAIPFWPEPEE